MMSKSKAIITTLLLILIPAGIIAKPQSDTTGTVALNKYRSFHTYQLGIELGTGDNSAPGTRFPFGPTIGGFLRYKNHSLGFRRDYFSDLQIFGMASYYKFLNVYYGFTIEKKHTSISAQMGLGSYETNFFGEGTYYGIGAELSIDLTAHVRGNGIGIRPCFNFNNKVNYVGILLKANLGWAWHNTKPQG